MRTALLAVTAVLLLAGCTSSSTGGQGTAAPASSSSSPQSSGPVPTSPLVTPPPGTGHAIRASSAAPVHPAVPAGGPVPRGFTPTSVTFISAAQGWVLGTAPCTGVVCTSVLRTRDGARHWQGIPAPSATLGQPDSGRNGDVSVLRFASARDGWAGVGRLYSTHDGGASWVRQQVGPATSVISSIETGGGYVFATVDGCPSQGSNSCAFTVRVYASPIGRDSWAPVSPAYRGGNGASGLVLSGRTWFLPTPTGISIGVAPQPPHRVASPCPADSGGRRPRPVLAVADPAHLDALCVGQGAAGSAQWQLYGTVDGGRTWVRAGGTHREPSGVCGAADNTRGVLLVAAASGGSLVLRTTDDGMRFVPARIAAPEGGIAWADLGFTTTTQAVVIAQDTAMYLSHDAGATWDRVVF